MGNPNARPKRRNHRRQASSQSDPTNSSAISPKTKHKPTTSSRGIFFAEEVLADNGANNKLTEIALAALNIREETLTQPALKFKPYKAGTLMTNNGILTGDIAAPLPPPKSSPKVSPKHCQLSATTPVFVPRIPKQLTITQANIFQPSPSTPLYQRVQNLLQEIRSTPSEGHGSRQVRHYTPYLPPPSSSMGTISMNVTPTKQPPIAPNRPPRTYYQRIEKSKKDIIITATGVTRNAVRVTERYLPNGTPYRNYLPEFNSPGYNFVADFNSMIHKAKAELLANKQVEIVVQLDSYDTDEKPEKADNSKADSVEEKGKGEKDTESSKSVDTNSQSKEWADPDQIMIEEATLSCPTVIDTIKALGQDFAANTRNLYVTLNFLSIPTTLETTSLVRTGPRVSPLSLNSPLVLGPNFTFLTSLVKTLQAFTAIKHMVVNLRVHSSHNPRPITIPQLTLILPFYDLGFTDWKVSYQTEFLSTSVPVKDNDYPLKWLDRERNKILREREKKLETAIFTQRSSLDRKIATYLNKK